MAEENGRDLLETLLRVLGGGSRSAAGGSGDVASTLLSQLLPGVGSGGGSQGVVGALTGSSGGASRFLSGLPLVGLIGRLLFGGGDEETAPAARPERFELPPPIELEAVLGPEGRAAEADRDQFGRPRAVATEPARPAPQVTIQVNALDSRSFLDHSEEIAQAVQSALLHSHSLNDVLREG